MPNHFQKKNHFICRFERYVSECYKDHLKREGKPEQLVAEMDVEEALDMLSAQGKWSKCLDIARSHGQVVLHKYVALYATDLLRVKVVARLKRFIVTLLIKLNCAFISDLVFCNLK